MDATALGLLFAGTAAGAAIGWLAASSRVRAELSARIAQAEVNAGSARAVADELRGSVDAERAVVTRLQAALDADRAARVEAETRLSEARIAIEAQRKLLDDSAKQLSDTFNSLSSEALKSNNQAFLDLARQSFEKLMSESKGDLDARREAVAALVKPIGDGLTRYEAGIREMEKARNEAYGSLNNHLNALGQSQQTLQSETRNLVNALKMPQVRGRWGEITLRRVVEVAGMSAYCDFSEQVSVSSEDGRLRPDMVIRLPNGRTVVVDSKASLAPYMEAMSPDIDDEARRAKLAHHARTVRDHIEKLASKQYWTQFEKSPDFVVLFLPGESIFSAALQMDEKMIEDGAQKRIMLATPSTLIALLRSVAYGWQQAKMAENAQMIATVGKELHKRLVAFMEHLAKTGEGLGKAVVSYNNAVGSFNSRVIPGAVKFKELGVSVEKDAAEIKPVEHVIREMGK
ncbi:MAG: DNA recombination protein RmuC [Nitrospirae bacterium]|nr:DNA recombination protein RmuC [Nitrospirota bacterium]